MLIYVHEFAMWDLMPTHEQALDYQISATLGCIGRIRSCLISYLLTISN